VIISEETALIGSANFTHNGITKNNEMSISITDFDKIQELNKWYTTWWQCALELETKELANLTEQVKDINYTKNEKRYISSKKLIKTYYEQISGDEEYLINFLKYWNNKDFTEHLFDLAQYMIEKNNINENDERLCITFREEKHVIPITIGQRYVLVLDCLTKSIGLIMPLEYNRENAHLDGSYKEDIYTLNQKDNAYCVYYKKEDEIKFNKITMVEWKNAVENELMRSKKSSYRKYHQVILYKLIKDKDYRNNIIRKIY
jgi:hypothetical protein